MVVCSQTSRYTADEVAVLDPQSGVWKRMKTQQAVSKIFKSTTFLISKLYIFKTVTINCMSMGYYLVSVTGLN